MFAIMIIVVLALAILMTIVFEMMIIVVFAIITIVFAIMISICISYSDPSVALFYQFVPQFFGLSRKIMEDGTKVFQK